ncbi:MAG: excinuclease ABC subunit UvrA [Marinilabiliales bacterium]
MSNEDVINIVGARVHNLKNVNITIPRNKLVVFTGVSGSGKSSLAFDTIHAEGQRRYLETFSTYARQFLGNFEKPDVEKISGLSPVIAIEQKSVNKNPRSTVGTVTEIYDLLRLLYARVAVAHSYLSGKKMIKYTEKNILKLIFQEFTDKNIYIMSPVVTGRKGHYKELFERFRKLGYLYAKIDGEIKELVPSLKLNRYNTHNISIIIDKLSVKENNNKRISNALNIALNYGKGTCQIFNQNDNIEKYYSKNLMDPETGLAYEDPAPHTFSFNSPVGACPECSGLGYTKKIDLDKIITDKNLSVKEGALVPLGKYKPGLIFWQIEAIFEKYNCKINEPIKKLPEQLIKEIIYGTSQPIILKNTSLGANSNYYTNYDGLISIIENNRDDDMPKSNQKWANQFISKQKCDICNGTRLKKESLSFLIDNKNIAEVSGMDISELYNWVNSLDNVLAGNKKLIAQEIISEIKKRIKFLLDVGLDYLSLSRSSASLSGGESQRIRLATQVGSKLVNVLYILDEPSIGLHQRDNIQLINTLKQLRNQENSIIVVEHDKEMIESADYIVDIGPGAGRMGGKVVFQGPAQNLIKSNTITAKYISGNETIPIPEKRREGNGKFIELINCSGNNLKNISIRFPLGKLICITGVSGSGKSSLVTDTLHPILNKHFYNSTKEPLPYENITGIENIDKVIEVDQNPIGKTPRSNPATYTGIFSDIRNIYEQLPESKIRGYKSGRFSFNVKGGRCEECKGAGVKTIEMNFLPDVYVVCDQCKGKRYNNETLQIRYKGQSISDILDMTINQAIEFFNSFHHIKTKLQALKSVGLGYIKLGQPSTTLSGGEAQRVKLAAELLKKDTGKTLYLLDEPTTGLHFEDIKILLDVIHKIVDKGNTMIIIEHNMDIIKSADYIIDMGPEGGQKGGTIVTKGTPEEIVKKQIGYTAKFLSKEINF